MSPSKHVKTGAQKRQVSFTMSNKTGFGSHIINTTTALLSGKAKQQNVLLKTFNPQFYNSSISKDILKGVKNNERGRDSKRIRILEGCRWGGGRAGAAEVEPMQVPSCPHQWPLEVLIECVCPSPGTRPTTHETGRARILQSVF